MPTARTCLVSFTDTEGIKHAVEVTASTLYDAAVLAVAEFRRCGFTAAQPGPATNLKIAVKAPATIYEVRFSKIEARLQSAGKPNEQGIKGRLRAVARRVREVDLLNAVFGQLVRDFE